MNTEHKRTAGAEKKAASQPAPVPPGVPQPGAAGSSPGPIPLHIPPLLLENDDPAGLPTVTGPGEKFLLTPAPAPAAPTAAPEGLPSAYGTGAFWLTACEPRSLCAQWDLTDAQRAQYQSQAVENHLVVRVNQEAPTSQPAFDVHVSPVDKHQFITVPAAAARYAATLGYYQPAGEWVTIAAATPATTPPETVSEDEAVQFATLALPSEPAPAPASAPAAPSGSEIQSPDPAAGLAPDYHGVREPCLLPPGTGLAAAPISAAAEFPAPDLESLQSAEVHWCAAPPCDLEDWTPAKKLALAELTTVAFRRGEGNSAELHTWSRSSVPGEAPAPPPQVPGPTALPTVPAEPSAGLIVGVSSPQGGPTSPDNPFWLKVNAEVILHGATVPGARLTLAGMPLELRPDGTFSCRFALPDGEFQVILSAASPSAEDRREVTLHLRRQTESQGEVGAHPGDPSLPPPPGAA